MAEDKALQWIIACVVYFVLITIFMSAVTSFVTEYNLDNEYVTSSGGSSSYLNAGGTSCDGPRMVEGLYYTENNPLCSKLFDIGSVYNNDTCNDIRGCDWVEEKFLGFLWGTSDFTCKGTINGTAYNNGVQYANTTAMRVWTKPVCGLYNLSTSESLCEAMGCTYYSDGNLPEVTYKKAPARIWGFVTNIITFRVNFYTGVPALNALLNLLLIWVPLIILMVSFFILLKIG